MTDTEDQIAFEMAGGGKRIVKNVPAGEGDDVLRGILEGAEPWIAVDRDRYINRSRIDSIQLTRATRAAGPPRFVYGRDYGDTDS